MALETMPETALAGKVLVVLDSTWKMAKEMFAGTPLLQTLPRVSLTQTHVRRRPLSCRT